MILTIFITIGCKKENEIIQNKREIVSIGLSVKCSDCLYGVILKNRKIEEQLAFHNTFLNFEIDKGDTVIIYGKTFDINSNMTVVLNKGNLEIVNTKARNNAKPNLYIFYVEPN